MSKGARKDEIKLLLASSGEDDNRTDEEVLEYFAVEPELTDRIDFWLHRRALCILAKRALSDDRHDHERLRTAAQAALDGWEVGNDVAGPMHKLRDVLNATT